MPGSGGCEIGRSGRDKIPGLCGRHNIEEDGREDVMLEQRIQQIRTEHGLSREWGVGRLGRLA